MWGQRLVFEDEQSLEHRTRRYLLEEDHDSDGEVKISKLSSRSSFLHQSSQLKNVLQEWKRSKRNSDTDELGRDPSVLDSDSFKARDKASLDEIEALEQQLQSERESVRPSSPKKMRKSDATMLDNSNVIIDSSDDEVESVDDDIIELLDSSDDELDNAHQQSSDEENESDIEFQEKLQAIWKRTEMLKLDQQEYAARNQASSGVVNLRLPFTDEEEDLYNIAMRGDPDAVLFERFNAKVYRSQLQTLSPGCWLNDEVINQYLSLLRSRSLELASEKSFPKCYFQFTHMYTKLMEGNVYDYSRVRRWNTRGLRKCDLFEMDMIFFPRNISNSHWTLCVAYIKEKRIEYLDSMGGAGIDCMDNVLRYIADEAREKKKMELDLSEWKKVSRKSDEIPQQDNCNDCGVFVSTFSNYLSLGQDLNFSAKDMPYFRKRICVDLLKGTSTFSLT